LLPLNPKYLVFCQLSETIKAKVFKAITLFVVPYGCESWSLALREDLQIGNV
jgi:hypothetical protein